MSLFIFIDWLGFKSGYMMFFVLCPSLLAVPFDGQFIPLVYSGMLSWSCNFICILLVSIYNIKHLLVF